MKSFRKLMICVIAFWAIGAISINYIMSRMQNSDERPYLLEVYRVAQEMEGNLSTVQEQADVDSDASLVNLADTVDLSKCHYVKRVVLCDHEDTLVGTTQYEYVVRKVNGQLYRFEYQADEAMYKQILMLVNGVLCVSFIVVLFVLLYIKTRIIDPFHRLEEVPYELSKGNLVMDIPEEKTKYFGRFVWGTNMLKDHLDEQRNKELALHKDKKMLLLSLTHDIKTPLSVIKLNAQALSRNLYKEEERRMQAVEEINVKATEIEQYVTEIVEASREEFLDLDVKKEEFYLSAVMNQIAEHYKGKMELHKIDFVMDSYDDCLLSGDENRIKEVLENLLENAIKYGDGKRIQISFEREQGCSLITVSNTGSSLKPEEAVKVFDSFFRGSNVGAKKGNGLGLYICRKLMKNMNGDIFVKQKDDVFAATIVVKMV